MRAIAEERRWRDPPLGPLGRYIRVKDKRFQMAVEKSLVWQPLLRRAGCILQQ